MVDQGIQNKAETQSESKEITPPGRKSLPKSTTPNRYHPYRRPNTKESSDRKEGPEDTSSVKPPRKSHKRVVSFGATVTESAISAELTTAPETTEEVRESSRSVGCSSRRRFSTPHPPVFRNAHSPDEAPQPPYRCCRCGSAITKSCTACEHELCEACPPREGGTKMPDLSRLFM